MKLSAVVAFSILWLSGNVQARCVMRGECINIGGFDKACPVDIEAPSLPLEVDEEEREELVDILGNRCPGLVFDEDGNRKPYEEIVTCCDAEQIRKMSDSLMLAEGVLGRCPTCYRNFVRQICEMNCSPDQSRFVTVYTENSTDGIEYVNEVDYRLHEDFMLGAHASCLGVVVPQTGLPAINLMCGNAPVCDAQSWFGFSGDFENNPLAPVQVNFIPTSTPENSMNAIALHCNETYDGDLPCSCVDCTSVCPTGTRPVVTQPCTVLSINCASFGVGVSFFVVGVTFFIIMTLRVKPSTTQNKNIRKDNKFIQVFQSIFAYIGAFVSSNPILVIMLTSWITFFMAIGVYNLNLTSNPIELWSAPDSRSRQELNYFNSRFGPFYRAAQVFLRFDGETFNVNNVTYGPAFRFENIQRLIELEDAIIDINRDNGGVTLEQVCYAPLRMRGGEQRLDQCVTMSVGSYFGGDRDNINNNTYLNVIQNCLNNHYALNCLSSWGGGAEPELSLGGYDDNMLLADTLLLNFPIANHLLEENLIPVLEWEDNFLELMHNFTASNQDIRVSFGAERSVEDEIRRVSVAEAVPIAISYVIMFIYVTFALGNIRSCRMWLIDSKVMVALGSILVELISIFCAMGVMGFANITATLLAINVIPFFVLSVGIDNVFLMVNALYDIENNIKSFSDYSENFSFDKRRRFIFSKMMGKVGPSMFVSSVTQVTCFAIGSLANFPAVVTFAVFATLSLAFLFVFQITTVVAILSLDYKRAHQNRLDIFCCIQKKILNDDDPLNSDTPHQSITQRLMEPYAKVLLKWRVKLIVGTLFLIMVFSSMAMAPNLDVGLDQEMALPHDSYVYSYLQAVNDLMHLGPPVYFVLKGGLNFSNVYHQNTICGGQMCNNDSLATQIFLAAQHSDVTFIARSSNSWLDDFFDWSSLYGSCCKYNTTSGGFCSSVDNSPECSYCTIPRDEWANRLRPSGEAFESYLPFFLQDAPTDICNKGGLASYFNNVIYVLDSEGRAQIHDSNFMAYHTNLRTSYDYISAVKFGYEISHNISQAILEHTGVDVEVFPYSVFYVYFEQYLTMWRDTLASLAYCILGAFILNLIASGFNLLTSFAVLLTSVMVIIDMMGVMYLWSIPLNAVSCVNLIVSIGIAVEFCSHIAYAFATSKAPREERVEDALKSVGPTVITGITFTNIPIIVLAFSYTEIIEVFFFRMFFSLVLLGFLHGMVFFPILLSYLNDIGRDRETKNTQVQIRANETLES
ncbi:NPC intracellular cholesterol transporter 1 homolog 1b-like [Amyelois transitella]|uniref:NPC intracellular cholesterol transporter 1 homolog 1b-like n=1 Tax=Amyelois transitella TaxID=680683 RepID=UPI0029902D22|nr:NPC intracellular cholesterol transporter 1 homolog 1b-like [Amyelois transitella]